ncbi:MAG: hypothetical protein FWB88_03560 [Defluviitaleaceae bacterium]|nr:hypothetical protein [Defluviitaleaceae bacterium]MCL2238739.1 hypothetical protein [Defluviitaleaceae bacterium]
MAEHGNTEVTEEVIALVASYANQGEFGRQNMAKKYPHIDFKQLIGDAELAQATHPVPSASESMWVAGLRIAAYINLISGVIGGLSIAYLLGTMTAVWGENINGGIFFFTFIAILVLTVITTAVIMVFLDMAQDISTTKRHAADTQRDIAEIKSKLFSQQ